MSKQTNPVEEKYLLSIDLSVLNDLGVNLYSNIPAVLSETVANAWDADAEKVEIKFDKNKKQIIISDNGCGMSEKDINGKYLTVGYKKRDAGITKTLKHKRPVMGRKGIGKLSLFSIANTVEVHSVSTDTKNKKEVNGFVMTTAGIEKAIRDKGGKYFPGIVPASKIKIKQGTQIILSDLKKDIVNQEANLRVKLARRFSVIGKDYKFTVLVGGKEISALDRDYFNKIQYLWTIGSKGKKYKKLCKNSKRHHHLDGIIDAGKKYELNGWVGTFDAHKNIEEGNNSIIILARGKLIHEDILKDMKEGGLFTKYLIGELEANFVDLDDQPDIATSDRQNLKEDNERFETLKAHIQKEIFREIRSNWQKWREIDATNEALENKSLRGWFDGLGSDKKKYAEKMFSVIGSLPTNKPEDKKELYRHGILAFEKLVLKDKLSELDNVQSEADFLLLQNLFGEIDELEAVEYYSIAKGRLNVLKKFEEMLPGSKEKMIQKYLFDHLWLLDATWERASEDEIMEEAVKKAFDVKKVNLSRDEMKGRLDIRYKTAAGKHVIIELKKPGITVNPHKLAAQISKYRSALEKCLKNMYPDEDHDIEIICILGKPPTGDPTRNRETLRVEQGRYMTYDTLIKQTKKSYGSYIEKQKKVERIQALVDSI